MRVAIFHYASYLKGAYATMELGPETTIGYVCDQWKDYFKNPNLKVFKFKVGRWADPHTGDHNNSFFDEKTTLQEYVNFYSGHDMGQYVQVIFV